MKAVLFIFISLNFALGSDFSLCNNFIEKSRLSKYMQMDDTGKIKSYTGKTKRNPEDKYSFDASIPGSIVIKEKHRDSRTFNFFHTNTILIKTKGNERTITMYSKMLDVNSNDEMISQTIYNVKLKKANGKCYPSSVSSTSGSGSPRFPKDKLVASLKSDYSSERCRNIKIFFEDYPKINSSTRPQSFIKLFNIMKGTSTRLRVDIESLRNISKHLEQRDRLIEAAKKEVSHCKRNHLQETIDEESIWSTSSPSSPGKEETEVIQN